VIVGEKKLEVIPPYKIVVVCIYILIFLTHSPPPPRGPNSKARCPTYKPPTPTNVWVNVHNINQKGGQLWEKEPRKVIVSQVNP